MHTEHSLHKNVAKNPWDNDLRGVYADYLQEQEDPTWIIHRFFHENNVRPLFGEKSFQFYPQSVYSDFSLPKEYLSSLHTFAWFSTEKTYMNSVDADFYQTLLKKWKNLLKKDISFVKREHKFVKTPLKFYQDQDPYNYNGNLESIDSIEVAYKNIQNGTLPSLFVIEAKVDNYYIPTLDFDYEPSFLRAIKIINFNKIPYALFESSPKRHWIVLDMPATDFCVSDVMYMLPGIDEKYARITRKRQRFILRAEKKVSCPKLLFSSVKTDITKYFLERFLEHWNDPCLDKIRKLRGY